MIILSPGWLHGRKMSRDRWSTLCWILRRVLKVNGIGINMKLLASWKVKQNIPQFLFWLKSRISCYHFLDQVEKIRDNYKEDWKSKEMKIRQRAVALYFIDKVCSSFRLAFDLLTLSIFWNSWRWEQVTKKMKIKPTLLVAARCALSTLHCMSRKMENRMSLYLISLVRW